ncbi:MAG: phospholipase D-like domain-containing protein [Candidatus Eisenbacteria bacterium]|nr:phospholipase D-like domain-containing protein [Candidatus Eisenbacteria bacterium]
MRTKQDKAGISVSAIAGTYVVFLGIDMAFENSEGLMGFAIHRTDTQAGTSGFMPGMKRFASSTDGLRADGRYSTEHQPLQSFWWADYTAEPGRGYTYRVIARKGAPGALSDAGEVVVTVQAEAPEDGRHDVYFNRGVAGSQAYARQFGDRRPNEVENGEAFTWLSRGLYEALEAFVSNCVPGRHHLRIAAYEFRYPRFLQLIRAAVDRGVDVRVVYDARDDDMALANDTAVDEAGLAEIAVRRTRPKSYIAHNKFIVKLDKDVPVAVWTGGTNFSEGGIFGHSNVAHVAEDETVARAFLDYWTALSQDPDSNSLKDLVETLTPLPAGDLPPGTTVVFSPRRDDAALRWYADLAMRAEHGVFMTFAFGMHDLFKEVYRNNASPFRSALLEAATRPMKDGPERDAERERIQDLRNLKANLFAIGNMVRPNQLDGWVQERLSGLNSHVRYVHNKFMLLNPLTRDPIVATGSANFSRASTISNDENMLVIRGDTRVADIYFGEFMRLYSHHAFRESLNWQQPERWLREDSWWREYFGDSHRSIRRQFFSGLEI